jgi:uncharacterized protein involved in tellurium resistance
VRSAYVDSMNPDANMITGLSKSIRSETLLKFATLDLDAKCLLCLEDTVKVILEVCKATFGPKSGPTCELEYMERNGCLSTPRIVNNAEINKYVYTQTKESVLESTPFMQDGRPMKMTIGLQGAFETLHFVDQFLEDNLQPDEIKIEVKAIGMNSRDMLAAMGRLETYNFGFECSRIVTRVGNDVRNIAVGNRIASISVSMEVYSSYSRTKEEFAFKTRDSLSFEETVFIPLAFCSAYYGTGSNRGEGPDPRGCHCSRSSYHKPGSNGECGDKGSPCEEVWY